ncbi:AAA family ATPase, partial [Vibrio fluvialis]|nr:AAA family ATPase [Vibrio fluvialis]
EKDKKERFIEVKISNKTENVTDIFSNLDILRRVGIIDNVRLTLSRKDKSLNYAYIDASSGEAQLLFSMTAFLRYVTDNCLVIIDEPEISLHPNWQIKYFSLLNLLLEKLNGCHVIIATHSHFLVSELNPKTSTLISLRKVEGIVKAENILSSTLGWSPESVLYRVFNVRTFNSLYLDSDLKKAHKMIYAKESDIEELNKLQNKFKSLVLDELDPLNKFIESIEEFINENK